MQPDNKANSLAHLETIDDGTSPMAIHKPFSEGVEVQMRSTLDDLPILKAVRIYWRVAAICMMAAFNAALEGYRTLFRVSVNGAVKLTLGFPRACAHEFHRLKQGIHPHNVRWRYQAQPYLCFCLGRHAINRPICGRGPPSAHH